MDIFQTDEEILEALDNILQIPEGSEDDLSDDDSDSEPTVLPIFNDDILEEADIDDSELSVSSPSLGTSIQPISTLQSKTASSDIIKYNRLIWKQRSFQRTEDHCVFNGNTQLPEEVCKLDTPLHFFQFFFNDEIINHICKETHSYSVQCDPNKPFVLNPKELRNYLGINVIMSVIDLPNTRLYWNEIVGNDTIKNTMSVKMFEAVKKHLHFNDNSLHVPPGNVDHDHLFKLRPILDHLNKKFSEIPLEESLCVDEQMCPSKVRHYLKQYMPAKPHKWGYKLFILSGVSGYAYRVELYSGLENDPITRAEIGEPDLGASANIVYRMSRIIPNNCHYKLYFDNYYTSLPLMVELEKRQIHTLGTFRRNRFPGLKLGSDKEMKKRPRGYSEECTTTIEDVDVTAVAWKDNKVVTLASTFVGEFPKSKVTRFDRKLKRSVEIECPKLVSVYNRHMVGVDLLDSLIGRYRNKMRSKKWYFKGV